MVSLWFPEAEGHIWSSAHWEWCDSIFCLLVGSSWCRLCLHRRFRIRPRRPHLSCSSSFTIIILLLFEENVLAVPATLINSIHKAEYLARNTISDMIHGYKSNTELQKYYILKRIFIINFAKIAYNHISLYLLWRCWVRQESSMARVTNILDNGMR